MALHVIERQGRLQPMEVVEIAEDRNEGRPSSALVQAVAASNISLMSGPTCSRAVRISGSSC